jgi:hypothetical protein
MDSPKPVMSIFTPLPLFDEPENVQLFTSTFVGEPPVAVPEFVI